MRIARNLLGLIGAFGLVAACSATDGSSSFLTSGGQSESGTGDSSGKGGDNLGFSAGSGTGSGAGAGGPTCSAGADEDQDKDGFTINAGDCNDCDANVNPGAIEVIASDPDAKVADEDCDGIADNAVDSCDDGIALGDVEGASGARALDLCQVTAPGEKKWGVIDSTYVRANGVQVNPGLGAGIQDGFGSNVNVQRGSRMLVLSSGHGRTPGQAGECGIDTCITTGPGQAPPGFPQDVPGCAGATDINDDIGLEVTLRAPTNATGYSYDFFFYSFEYPEWVCTSFNDQFIALVNPPPVGSINGNISFDSMNNPVSVNIAFFEVCPGCPLGVAQMAGTGFDVWEVDPFTQEISAGGTSWLNTQAPVTGGQEFSIRFAIWDTGDQALDSTVLIDNFQWIANGGTVAIGTDPIDTPQ